MTALRGVTLRGPVLDAAHEMRGAWVYVQPSRKEPFGLAVLEAAAQGIPAVVTRVGGLVDVVVDGATGVFVEPNDPEALATAVVALIEDSDRRHAMGENARRRVADRFSEDAFATALTTLYAERLR